MPTSPISTPTKSPWPVPSRVFPLPGWTGPIVPHGAGVNGGSDLMVSSAGTQAVVSMVTGTVQYVSTEATAPNSGGNAVQIHGIDGLDYYYAHLSTPTGLRMGDTVNAGQQLGFAGNSGNAKTTAPHLHIGIGNGISTGVGAPGGVGQNFDAVNLLKSLQKVVGANDPNIVSSDVQRVITSGSGAGTITLLPVTNAPASMSLTDRIKWLAGLLQAAGVDPSKIPTLVAISLAENHGSDTNATSSTYDVGLWQINVPVWGQKLGYTADQLKDPVTNAKAAAQVLQLQGLDAWVTFKEGLHNTYIASVQAALAGVNLGGGQTAPTPQPGGENGCGCPNVQYGPITIPDIGCTITCAISKLITEWKKRWLDWWNAWTEAHAASIGFVIIGGALILIAVAALIGGNKEVRNMAKVAAVA